MLRQLVFACLLFLRDAITQEMGFVVQWKDGAQGTWRCIQVWRLNSVFVGPLCDCVNNNNGIYPITHVLSGLITITLVNNYERERKKSRLFPIIRHRARIA